MQAIDIFLDKGKQGLILHRDWLSREEKDVVRERFGPEGRAGVWFLETPEQDDASVDELALASHEEFEDDQRKEQDGGEPTMADLRGLTVAQLKDLASMEEVDLSDLKLKDDILGRLAAHFGLDPAQ